MKRWKNSKKGMTLVELIISSVVTVIVISAACTVLYFSYSNYTSGTNDLSNHQNASLLEDYLQHDLSTATSVTVGSDQSAVNSGVGVQLSSDKIISMHFDNKVFVIVEKDSSGVKSTARITGIESVSLNTVPVGSTQKLNYEIKASSKSKQSFLLTGGVVMNNCSDSVKTKINTDTTDYFNIQMPNAQATSSE
jgi:Tfp pilus assembly protein PilW